MNSYADAEYYNKEFHGDKIISDLKELDQKLYLAI